MFALTRGVRVVYVTRAGTSNAASRRETTTITPMDFRGHILDSHDTTKLDHPWGRVEDFIYSYQVVSTPTVVIEFSLPIALASPLSLQFLTIPAWYLPSAYFQYHQHQPSLISL